MSFKVSWTEPNGQVESDTFESESEATDLANEKRAQKHSNVEVTQMKQLRESPTVHAAAGNGHHAVFLGPQGTGNGSVRYIARFTVMKAGRPTLQSKEFTNLSAATRFASATGATLHEYNTMQPQLETPVDFKTVTGGVRKECFNCGAPADIMIDVGGEKVPVCDVCKGHKFQAGTGLQRFHVEQLGAKWVLVKDPSMEHVSEHASREEAERAKKVKETEVRRAAGLAASAAGVAKFDLSTDIQRSVLHWVSRNSTSHVRKIVEAVAQAQGFPTEEVAKVVKEMQLSGQISYKDGKWTALERYMQAASAKFSDLGGVSIWWDEATLEQRRAACAVIGVSSRNLDHKDSNSIPDSVLRAIARAAAQGRIETFKATEPKRNEDGELEGPSAEEERAWDSREYDGSGQAAWVNPSKRRPPTPQEAEDRHQRRLRNADPSRVCEICYDGFVDSEIKTTSGKLLRVCGECQQQSYESGGKWPKMEAGSLKAASAEYEKALQVVNDASKVYRKLQEDYRARRIGDEEFLRGKKIYQEAERAFDQAYAKEEKQSSMAATVSASPALTNGIKPIREAPKMAGGFRPVGGIGQGPVEVKPGFTCRWKNSRGEQLGRTFPSKEAAEALADKLRREGGWDGPVSGIQVVPENRAPGAGPTGRIPDSIGS